jgi:hypothetical protein
MLGLQLLDLLLIIVHFVVIGFNLFGWIWKRTRKAHFIVICATAACWRIKEKLGIHNLPNSFIKYYADMLTGHSIDANLIDTLTAAGFFIAALLSVYFNFIQKRSLKK